MPLACKRAIFPMLLMAVTLSGAAIAGAPRANQEPVEVTVTAQPGFSFQPEQISVPAGAKVRLTLENAGVMGHNLNIPALGKMTRTITGDETDTLTFTVGEVGTNTFRCEVPGHAEAGMVGELKVTAPEHANEPAS